MRFPRNAKVFRGQIDAAPVATVLFLTLMFLLVHSSLVFAPGVRIRLPDAGPLPGITNATLVVVIDAGGQLYFENQLVDEPALQGRMAEAVKRAHEPLTLLLQADGDVRHEKLMRVYELARKAGIDETALAARLPLFPGPGNDRR
jgi:biopolymer transport protein ExbD